MARTAAVPRLVSLLAAALAWGALAGAAVAGDRAAGQSLRIVDLDGRRIDPLKATPTSSATVFVFTTIECPISNRYAPELGRLHGEFAPIGVRFVLVFADPNDEPAAIRAHLRRFDLAMAAVRDPRHDLVRLTKATVTPEAAVFDTSGRMVYRGRIDDRHIDFGIDRPQATTRDLRDALLATLAGHSVPHPETKAVGCFLADLVR
jgi:hypothetical protein